jgi:hypothetical protein
MARGMQDFLILPRREALVQGGKELTNPKCRTRGLVDLRCDRDDNRWLIGGVAIASIGKRPMDRVVSHGLEGPIDQHDEIAVTFDDTAFNIARNLAVRAE